MGSGTVVNITSISTLNIIGIAYFNGQLVIELAGTSTPRFASRHEQVVQIRNVVQASQVGTTPGPGTTAAVSGSLRQQVTTVASYSSSQV
jgi:hypothetical protein